MFFKAKYEKMNINDVEKLDSPNIIDVRTKEEYATGHLPKAKNIEMNSLLINPSHFLNKDEKYYIYCQSGGRSSMTCSGLQKEGYDVCDLGGIMSYNFNK